MRPAIQYEATSALGANIAVLVTYPAGQPWFVVFDRRDGTPLHETDDERAAMTTADAHAQAWDLSFVVKQLSESSTTIYLHSDRHEALATSQDGLPLICDPDLILASTSVSHIGLSQAAEAFAASGSELQAAIRLATDGAASKPGTLVFSFVETHEVEDDGEPRLDAIEHYVHLTMKWGQTNELDGFQLDILDEQATLNKQPLYKVLLEIQSSPEHELYFADRDELQDCQPVAEKMPHFSAYVEEADPAALHGYAYEGGPVLESLKNTHPWLVSTDLQGRAVPMRFIQTDVEELAHAMTRDQHKLAEIYLIGELTQHVRGRVIAQQRKLGLAPGQSLDGKQFRTLAKFDARVALEIGEPPRDGNIQYRIWSDGELVIEDELPENKHSEILHQSPSDGAVAMVLSQILDAADSAGSTARQQAFINSVTAINLLNNAVNLLSGNASIKNGLFTHTLKVEETPSQAKSASWGPAEGMV